MHGFICRGRDLLWQTTHRGYDLLPTSAGEARDAAKHFSNRIRTSSNAVPRRWVVVLLAALFALTLAVPLALARYGLIPVLESVRARPEWWGRTEAEGWVVAPGSGLMDLGEEGERAYRLGVTAGDEGMVEYFTTLHEFIITLPPPIQDPLLNSLLSHLPDRLAQLLPLGSYTPQPAHALIDYQTIYLTDASASPETARVAGMWNEYNSAAGWEVEFYDDAAAEAWMESVFKGSDVAWAWGYMRRGVLKADFFRYLIPLIRGGVYADVDVEPVKPIDRWGWRDVEYLSLAGTDGPEWKDTLSAYPSIVVGVEVDVHSHPAWQDTWVRPIQICQWTLGSTPSHPIMLDAVRRVVNATRVVRSWETWRAGEVANMRAAGMEASASEAEAWDVAGVMPVLEWTGPGLFTDAVMAFLLARYNVTWHRIRGLDHPLRIGDVLILPITAFSPGGEPDFRSGHHWDPQAAVMHNFRGSWKEDGFRRRR